MSEFFFYFEQEATEQTEDWLRSLDCRRRIDHCSLAPGSIKRDTPSVNFCCWRWWLRKFGLQKIAKGASKVLVSDRFRLVLRLCCLCALLFKSVAATIAAKHIMRSIRTLLKTNRAWETRYWKTKKNKAPPLSLLPPVQTSSNSHAWHPVDSVIPVKQDWSPRKHFMAG